VYDADWVVVILRRFDDEDCAALTQLAMRKFINAPMGGGGSSPATIFFKYSSPDKPTAAFARSRGSSQVIVRVRVLDIF